MNKIFAVQWIFLFWGFWGLNGLCECVFSIWENRKDTIFSKFFNSFLWVLSKKIFLLVWNPNVRIRPLFDLKSIVKSIEISVHQMFRPLEENSWIFHHTQFSKKKEIKNFLWGSRKNFWECRKVSEYFSWDSTEIEFNISNTVGLVPFFRF